MYKRLVSGLGFTTTFVYEPQPTEGNSAELNLRKPLKPACTIPFVVSCPFLLSGKYIYSFQSKNCLCKVRLGGMGWKVLASNWAGV